MKKDVSLFFMKTSDIFITYLLLNYASATSVIADETSLLMVVPKFLKAPIITPPTAANTMTTKMIPSNCPLISDMVYLLSSHNSQ